MADVRFDRGDEDACKGARFSTVFSFVVDAAPSFAYKGWHLARSLVEHCGGDPSAIHVQCTPEVSERTRDLFRERGYNIHEISRFGDGRYCNKLGQLDSLRAIEFDRVVLLDTDTIAIADIRPFLDADAVMGVMVGLARPPLETLREIAVASGLSSLPAICPTAIGGQDTYLANCNGGLYCVPKRYCEDLSRAWRRWALWLLDNIEPLSRIDKQNHVDQVAFWLAMQHENLPFAAAVSNVNYHTHVEGEHFYLDETRDIALLHYHNHLDVVGMLEAPPGRGARETAAVARANAQIGRGFDNRVFWGMRYGHFPQRGSGLGSRGDNLLFKRALLKEHGIEEASSVLDFGCGDLEVVKALQVKRYLGVDQSPESLAIARRARPDWEFRLAPADVPAAEMVLCLEVLIHQETEAAYRALIAVLAQKTLGTLLVSGFRAASEGASNNPILFYYEPLEESLHGTGRFRAIREIGNHSGVVVYRCDV